MAIFVNITSGQLSGLWKVIKTLNQYPDVTYQEIHGMYSSSGQMGGSIPIQSAIDLGKKYDLLTHERGKLVLTRRAVESLDCSSEGEELEISNGRAILQSIILKENFEWLLFYQSNPEEFKIYIPENWQQLLDEMELLNFNNFDVQLWWKQIFDKYKKYKEGQKLQIGIVGEKLSFDFEHNRLNKEGHINIDYILKWVSQISDVWGYDILSDSGTLLKAHCPQGGSVNIEVKAQINNDIARFRFYVSRNEWNVASRNLEKYFFYCWVNVDVNRETAVGPYIIPAKIFEKDIPIDQGTLCSWSECRFIIDLNTFSIFDPISPN